MKLSQDLYDAGILRHQRTGPSDEWAFDEPGVNLPRVFSGVWARLRSRLFVPKASSYGRPVHSVYRQQGGLR